MSGDYRFFIKVHNGFPEHGKTVGLSDRAFRKLIEAWCYCSRNLNNGRLTDAQVSQLFSQKVRDELITAGYLEKTETRWEMHDYLDHQISAEQVADLREKRADAGRRGGNAKAKHVASASAVAKQTSSKPLPDIDKEEEVTTKTDSHLSNATVDPRIEDEPRSKPVDVSSMKLLRAYTDIVGLTDKGRACATITAARAHYSEERIVAALDRMAHDKRTLTPDALRIEIDSGGKPRLPHGMTIDENGVTRLATGMPVAGPGWEAY